MTEEVDVKEAEIVESQEPRASQATAGKNPSRLSKLAPMVIAGLAEKQPDWFREFEGWFLTTFGVRPSQIAHKRGAEEWNCAFLGAFAAWGYFDAVFKAMEDQDAKKAVEDDGVEAAPGSVEEQEGAPVAEPSIDARIGLGHTYKLLGPDGRPVVEGVK